MPSMADLVHERHEENIYASTRCRWPYCRPYDDMVVIQTTAESALNNNLPRAIRADVITQKMRDQKTAKELESAFSIFSIILTVGLLVLSGRQLYKWHLIK